MSPYDEVRVTFHFQERYWFECGPGKATRKRDGRIGRSLVLDVPPDGSLENAVNLYIGEHPDEFPAFRVADGFQHAELILMSADVEVEDWRYDGGNHSLAIELIVNEDASVEWLNMDNEWGPSVATPNNVGAAIDAGFLKARRDEYVVTVRFPVGGDWAWWPEVGQWLLDQGVDLGLEPVKAFVAYKIGAFFTKYIRNGRRARRAQRVAMAWHKRGLTAPFQLRQFVDLKREWTLDELSKALAVEPVVSKHESARLHARRGRCLASRHLKEGNQTTGAMAVS